MLISGLLLIIFTYIFSKYSSISDRSIDSDRFIDDTVHVLKKLKKGDE